MFKYLILMEDGEVFGTNDETTEARAEEFAGEGGISGVLVNADIKEIPDDYFADDEDEDDEEKADE